MEWLTQNWIWLLVLGGAFFMMRRGGMGCGMAGHSSHTEHNVQGSDPSPRADTAAPTDPVSGQAVDQGTAVSSVYRGRIYYFASRESRDCFEQAPDRYATAGAAVGPEAEGHQQHRHGC